MMPTVEEMLADHAAEIERLKTAHAAEIVEWQESDDIMTGQWEHTLHRAQHSMRMQFVRELKHALEQSATFGASRQLEVLQDGLQTLIARHGFETYHVITVDDKFVGYYDADLEQKLCDEGKLWRVWYLSKGEMNYHGFPLPEEVAQNA
jgi:hypothetical protein